MTTFLGRLNIFLVATLLLFTANCTKVNRLVQSADPYKTETYKRICDKWTREARIHRGLEVLLIASATLKSDEFRRAYAEEYAAAYELTSEEEEPYLENQVDVSCREHEFLMAGFVPENSWDDFDKVKSMWKLYLVNDKNERVVPIEVRKIKRRDAVMPHFFPYITPWKSVYTVRFPHNIGKSDRPIIGGDTKQVRLVITGVLGTAEMAWNLE